MPKLLNVLGTALGLIIVLIISVIAYYGFVWGPLSEDKLIELGGILVSLFFAGLVIFSLVIGFAVSGVFLGVPLILDTYRTKDSRAR